jgi:hypothetical protein
MVNTHQYFSNLFQGRKRMAKEPSQDKHPAHAHHTKAAEHHEHAMKHHKEAAGHYAAGHHETAAHHAHTAHAHTLHAAHHAGEAAKVHVSHSSKKSWTIWSSGPRRSDWPGSFLLHDLKFHDRFSLLRGFPCTHAVALRKEIDISRHRSFSQFAKIKVSAFKHTLSARD